MTPYSDQLNTVLTHDAVLGQKLSRLVNLEAIIRWIGEEKLDFKRFDSLQQDEYNYDVIFPWSDHRWIAFGVS